MFPKTTGEEFWFVRFRNTFTVIRAVNDKGIAVSWRRKR